MAQIQSSINDGSGLIIDPTSKAARVTFYDTLGNPISYGDGDQPAKVSGFAAFGVNDRSILPLRVDRLGSQAVASHTPLLSDSFEGTAPNPLRWNLLAVTMTVTQSSAGGLVFNGSAITTINTGHLIQSSSRFMKNQRAPLQAKFRARMERVNNSIQELGFGDVGAVIGNHTSGAYWQAQANGAVVPVLTFNGVDLTGTDVGGLLDPNKFYTFDVFLDDDQASYSIQDTTTGLLITKQVINLPLSAQRLFAVSQVAAFARLYTTNTAPATAPRLYLTDVYVLVLDMLTGKDWGATLSSLDRSAIANPFTGVQVGAWANSAEPASAVLSNTAAGYTTLGGKFQFAAAAGAATDYALFAFQAPAPGNLVITGIDIEAWNLGAAVATTPTLLTWALGIGSTAVSLATANISRLGVGAQDFPIGAVIGARAARISKQFKTPIKVGSNRYVHLILRMPVGTATASQIIAGMANFEGYFE